jgi:hypothetical protein
MARSKTTFQPGNRAAAKHGLRSSRLRAEHRRELAQGIRDQVLARWAHLGDQEPLLSMLIDALTDVRQARDWLDAQGGPLSAGGRPYKAVEMLRARERDARDLADRLLISPREMARLGDAAGLRPFEARWKAAQERVRLIEPREEMKP